MKISGQCGRLKCCLNYELETYLDALEDIPNVHHIETAMGPGVLQKTDIFKKIMWFSYQGESTWIPIEVHFVKEMLEMNRKGVKPESLHHGTTGDNAVKIEKIDFVDVVGQSQHRNEPSRKKGKRKSSDRRDDRPRGENRNAGGENRNENRPQSENRPQTQNRNQNRPANNPNQDRPNPESKEANAGGPKEGGQPRNNPNRGPRNNQGRNQRPPNRQGPADSNRPRSYDRPPPNDNPGA